MSKMDGQFSLFDLDICVGRTCPEPSAQELRQERISELSLKKPRELATAEYLYLDLRAGYGNLLGPYWEINSRLLGEYWTLNTGASPSVAVVSFLSQILVAIVPAKYYLSKAACLGILRRASVRGKELPPLLKYALEIQAELIQILMQETETIAFCCNQRDEVRDLNDFAGALQAQPGMKQQTFVVSPEEQSEESSTEYLTPWDIQGERIFTENGVSPTLASADGGGGRNPAGLVFAAGVITKGNGECILTEEKHTSLTSGGGQAGQGYPCVMTAGFCANASAEARSIGFQEECSPTLKGSTSGMPSVICLNDQGGQRMDIYEDITGTLRAQMDGHPPLVLATQQGGAEIGVGICPTITSAAGTSGNNQPVLFENHGVDSRYTGPHDVSPTISHRDAGYIFNVI